MRRIYNLSFIIFGIKLYDFVVPITVCDKSCGHESVVPDNGLFRAAIKKVVHRLPEMDHLYTDNKRNC